MRFPPEAFIIGAQKAGTTSLAELLARHPDVRLAEPKEPQFFTRNWDNGQSWYRGCFQDAPEGSLLLDASTTYTMASLSADARDPPWRQQAPSRLKQVSPQARFIYIVRDPAERTWSGYWHTVRTGHEARPFRRAVDENPGYLATSDYAAQIVLWLDQFPRERFLFLHMDDLARPAETARRCFAFFGLDAEAVRISGERPRNRSYQYSRLGRLVRDAAGGEFGLKRIARPLKRVLPGWAADAARSLLATDVPRLPDEERRWLGDYFHSRNEAFRAISGIDLNR